MAVIVKMIAVFGFLGALAYSQNILLDSSCLSVRLSACISSAATGWISMKLDSGDFYEILSRKSEFD
jgi:hypothetical protein